MLSLRGLLRCHSHCRALTLSATKFRDKKEPAESTTDNVEEQNFTKEAAEGGGQVKEHSDSRGALKEHVEGQSGLTEHVASPSGVKEHVAPLYDVAWPAVVAGEVQVKDSEPPVEIDVRRRVKGVGIWDAGMEDYPYRGHANSAPYPVPTAPPPLGPSRLEVWRSLEIESVPQTLNRPMEKLPGLVGRVTDEIADTLAGAGRNFLQPQVVIRENTDPRSIVAFPPRSTECTQLWYEEPAQETTMGFPVIRQPHPFDRIREGVRVTKSSAQDYPWIQDFQSTYDVLIVGGGIVGSMIAFMLTNRVDTGQGFKIGIIEKDPSYRYSLSACSPAGIRVQHGLPETIESSLFGTDFYRNIGLEMSIPGGTEDDEDYLNVPDLKFQPHGHLTLAKGEDMEEMKSNHEIQKALGVQSALLTVRQLNQRFPWLETTGIEGAVLGLEAEGWMDNWNLLRGLKLRNIHQGIDYIRGEVIYMKKRSLPGSKVGLHPGMGRYEDGSEVPFAAPHECHVLLPEDKLGTRKVYPLQFASCIIAAGGESGNVGKMAGIGDGTGMLSVEIPVERRRQYVFQVHSDSGPGLNLPITTDPSGLLVRRQGHCGDYLVGLLPRDDEEVPTNMWGDVEPSYWEEVVRPLLQARVKGFEGCTLKGSYPVDYDNNYYDGNPIVGKHPFLGEVFMACGLGGQGAAMAPAIGRGIAELMFDSGYTTIDLSRYAFDRVLNGATIKEKFFRRN